MNAVEEAILKLDARLEGAPFDFVFLGGSVLSLLVTDPTVDAIRVTKDVDVIANIKSRREFHSSERALERLGFRHDTREDAPICRWICDGVTVDVLPVREEVLGWRSTWFESALRSAMTVDVQGRSIRVVSAPYFVALKLEAFEERGGGDFITSVDFEDVICLFNGREAVAEEIAAEREIGKMLGAKFAAYLRSDILDDAIEGFVQTERNPDERKTAILSRFRKVAALADG
ncbi:MAG: hypothetical protein IJH50_05910 [Kiritimatiellae bacterium]|nr:hypothetical protein [Kiritimatiellia bacterium]